MKKLLAIAISLSLVCSFSTIALAENTTVLTTTVPDATYTLNIPADQEIPFGETQAEIGNVTVTDSAGFAKGKDLQVTLTYEPFKADGVSTTIPYKVRGYNEEHTSIFDFSFLIFVGLGSGEVENLGSVPLYEDMIQMVELFVDIPSEDWGKALAGEYSSTITFTAEVVVSEP